MKRTRTNRKKYVESSDSEDEIPAKRSPLEEQDTKKMEKEDSSSSESDIENYLQKPEELDLNSDFFNTKNTKEFENIEKNIFSGVRRISDSESGEEPEQKLKQNQSPKKEPVQNDIHTTKLIFNQLQNYTNKMEEAKKQVELYKAKKRTQENSLDVSNLLAAGEKKLNLENINAEDLHSSDFESCDSELEWEEIKSQEPKFSVPEKGLQITVDMPDTIKKKKGLDLVAAMKRRLNRIKKENQILVHRVHLLCYIAHGNYVNSAINDTNNMALALSLLPSEHCYPPNRTDLSYLEKIVAWYKRTIVNIEKPVPKTMPLNECLQNQIQKRQAYNKKMLVLIFIIILRSLGIQTRLVMSLQVEPLRPPSSELHSLSTKENSKKSINNDKPSTSGLNNKKKTSDVKITIQKSTPEKLTNSSITIASKLRTRKSTTSENSKLTGEVVEKVPEKKTSSNTKPKRISTSNQTTKTKEKSKSEETLIEKSKKNIRKRNQSTESIESIASNSSRRSTRSQSKKDEQITKLKTTDNKRQSTRSRSSKAIKQLDGLYDSDSDAEMLILQLDGNNDNKKSKKPNLNKLKPPKKVAAAKKPNLKSLSNKKLNKQTEESDSDSDFEPANGSPLKTRLERAKVDLDKLKTVKTSKKDIKKDIVDLMKERISKQKAIERSKLVKKRKPDPAVEETDSDSYYAPEPIRKKYRDSEDDFVPKTKVKKRVQVRPVLSESESDNKKKKFGNDVWAEVFLEAEEKWISVDVIYGQVHCVKEIAQRATHPVSYVIAWDNNNNLKDVTQRYCPNFNTVTRKLRIDQKWWMESLKPFMGIPNARDKEEDEDLARQQLDQPLPKIIGEYKNHPLYVLRRHLLKFEAIYPPEPATLGFIRGEAVYPRSCVYTLHSRDIWLKQAKVVKLGEEPYKIVKARPKWDKLSNKAITDQTLEIFGPWQVQDYEPPTAENGKVPRNAFGNVDLFKSCMLPKGCVHLKLPGLNKIAKRMDIDCASAIVGFDFHGGWSHPVYDGFVVCEEFKDQLISAWEFEQDELDKKEQEKIDKRVYGNWRKLIRGLLIRERLKAKYDFGRQQTESHSTSKGKKKSTKK